MAAEKWIVRVADDSFVEREEFDSFEKALAYATKMEGIFGTWNVDMYKA